MGNRITLTFRTTNHRQLKKPERLNIRRVKPSENPSRHIVEADRNAPIRMPPESTKCVHCFLIVVPTRKNSPITYLPLFLRSALLPKTVTRGLPTRSLCMLVFFYGPSAAERYVYASRFEEMQYLMASGRASGVGGHYV